MHISDKGYNENNWLLTDIPDILSLSPKTVLEVGAGNLRSARKLASNGFPVIAVDWINLNEKSLPERLVYKKLDLLTDSLPIADLVCSADVLEHIPAENIFSVVEKLVNNSRIGYLKIACYDDGHSHLTLISPLQWLDIFKRFDMSYYIKSIEFRKENLAYPVVIITNGAFSASL